MVRKLQNDTLYVITSSSPFQYEILIKMAKVWTHLVDCAYILIAKDIIYVLRLGIGLC